MFQEVESQLIQRFPGQRWMRARSDDAFQATAVPAQEASAEDGDKRAAGTVPAVTPVVRGSWPLHLLVRTLLVAVWTFAAAALPFFGSIMGLVGALGEADANVWLRSRRVHVACAVCAPNAL